MKNTLIEKVKQIVTLLTTALPACSPVSVGGSVRDALMLNSDDVMSGFEHNTKDFDLEIFGVNPKDILDVLNKTDVKLLWVGRAFPVYKVEGYDIDISFPRTESKYGTGHTDFAIETNPHMTFTDAAKRRDFTVNAIGYDWRTKTILDPYNGRADIINQKLKPVSEAFKEDALRVLRAFKFIARYGFLPTNVTIAYCRDMLDELRSLSRERILGEWNDFILKGKGKYVADAMAFLWRCGAVDLFPELKGMDGCQQSPIHHPEGDVLQHTIHCLKWYMDNCQELNDPLIIGYAVLTHDMGKPECTLTDTTGKITAHGHEDSKVPQQFLERLFDPADEIIPQIMKLVKAHMRPYALYDSNAGTSAYRRLIVAVDGQINRLHAVVMCDIHGRPPIKAEPEASRKMIAVYQATKTVASNTIEPIIKGRHLLEHLKMTPGKEFKPILNAMFELQLDGIFDTEESGLRELMSCYSVSS